MPNFKDITSQRFGRLVAIEIAGSKDRKKVWSCQCDCGKTAAVIGKLLRNGGTKSCGCLKTIHGHARKHRLTPEFWTWTAMHKRCYQPTAKDYKRYGGRGITVCQRWHQFVHFLADMGPRPEGHTIDRIDNNGNYEPGNCRWSTPPKQRENQRSHQRERDRLGRYV